MRIPWLAYISLSLLALVIAQQQHPPLNDATTPDTPEDTPHLDVDGMSPPFIPKLTPVCAPLVEARLLLKELEPAPNSHLERKLGSISALGSRGWSDGLGWNTEGPLSTALRMLPRVVNTLLSPLTFLSRLVSNSNYAAQHQPQKMPKRYKVSKARKAKIDRLLELLEEAEKADCEESYGLKANIKMVCLILGRFVLTGSSRREVSSKTSREHIPLTRCVLPVQTAW